MVPLGDEGVAEVRGRVLCPRMFSGLGGSPSLRPPTSSSLASRPVQPCRGNALCLESPGLVSVSLEPSRSAPITLKLESRLSVCQFRFPAAPPPPFQLFLYLGCALSSGGMTSFFHGCRGVPSLAHLGGGSSESPGISEAGGWVTAWGPDVTFHEAQWPDSTLPPGALRLEPGRTLGPVVGL